MDSTDSRSTTKTIRITLALSWMSLILSCFYLPRPESLGVDFYPFLPALYVIIPAISITCNISLLSSLHVYGQRLPHVEEEPLHIVLQSAKPRFIIIGILWIGLLVAQTLILPFFVDIDHLATIGNIVVSIALYVHCSLQVGIELGTGDELGQASEDLEAGVEELPPQNVRDSAMAGPEEAPLELVIAEGDLVQGKPPQLEEGTEELLPQRPGDSKLMPDESGSISSPQREPSTEPSKI
ncbi:hypothetical protein BDQ12DRAFT_685408 [Crucibulum laeve]|uniref:Transmembrane protein n=1 Tax=Crucibulum laeve TaxID=68775 RepID=A0A5C3M043_9AGAR|nr:hypothetical protein BDQ12DRAFT_685408 [Crucibulum laeve]